MRKQLRLCFMAICLLLLSACGGDAGQGNSTGRETVTIALWSGRLMEQYCTYLQESFPEVDFEFYIATNSTDFYRFKAEQNDLPDILTVRRFALRDVADWKDQLMDLSDCALTNTFHQTYLRSYTYDDGTVNWLPACAEVDGIVANRNLLEEHNLALPTNYAEFVALCGALNELGIQPFQSNFSADFTCMEVLQGLSIDQLTSQAGREWRQQYESGQTDQLSEEVWLPVFQRMEEFIGYTGLTADNLEREHVEILSMFQNGELAMMRGTGNEAAIRESVNGSHVMLPYFGETAEESWYLTYPTFQVAASARAEETPERRQLILDILTVMLNQKGLEHISSGQNMVPYNKEVELELSPELSNLQPYLADNRLYIRLASSEMFAISKTVVQGMLTGVYPDARSALDAFNAALKTETEAEPVVAHVETGYSYRFRPQGGNQAASAVLNSVREELNTQLVFGQTADIAGSILPGDYTRTQLNFLTTGDGREVLLCTVTGEQLYHYITCVLEATDIQNSVCNDATLYVSSGFAMELSRTDGGYTLDRLTVDGRELDRTGTYTLGVVGFELLHRTALESAGVTAYTTTELRLKQILTNRLMEGRPLAAPADYITLR